MSHQTGIQANRDLQKLFHECQSGKYRAIKISIDKEELCCSAKIAASRRAWDKDYDEILHKLIEKDVPCYILYRLDEKTSLGFAWLLFTWIPDTANVRNKMMYASTKATLKTNFGNANIIEEVHATTLTEVNITEYYKNKVEKHNFIEEENLEEFRKLDITTHVSTGSAIKTLGGLDFPVTESAKKGIRDLNDNRFNYLQFTVDIQKEVIDLSAAKNIQAENLSKEISNDKPQYHLFVFQHYYDGEWRRASIFIYSMPMNVKSIKEKMLYSSCKNAFIDRLNQYNVIINKKFEVDDPNEINETFLLDEIYPKAMVPRPQFAKPRGPPNRGAKRLTKIDN